MPSATPDVPVDDLLAAAFEVAGVGICFTDERGVLLRVNPGFCEITGYPADECVGRHWTFAAPPDVVAVADRFAQAAFSNSPRLAREWRIKRRDGRILHALVSARAIERPGGERALVVTFTDIEDRKTAEEQAQRLARDLENRVTMRTAELNEQIRALEATQAALADSEAQYRNVVDNAGESIAVFQDEVIVFANARMGALLGRPLDQIVGRRFHEFLYPDDRAMVHDRHQRRLRGEDVPTVYPFRVARPDGSAAWVELSVVLIDWRGRGATLGFLTDISHRRAQEEALARSEEQYRRLVENVSEGIMIVQDGRIVFANPRVAQILGHPIEVLMTQTFPRFIHPDDRAAAVERATRRLRGDTMDRHSAFRVVAADGRVVWIELSVVLIDWEGRGASLSFVTDTSERVALQERLKHTLRERETILDNSIVGIAFLNTAGRLVWANAAAHQMFRTPRDGLAGQSMEPYYPSHEEYVRVGGEVAKAVAAGKTYRTELPMRRADGTAMWVHLSGKAVNPYDLSQGTVWSMLDINERKRLEEDLRRTTSQREAILQSTLVGITYTVDRKRQWVNKRFAEMLGFEPAELIGEDSRRHFPDAQRWRAIADDAYQALTSHGSHVTECELIRRDGTSIWVEVHGSCLEQGHPERGAIWTYLDVTERRRAAEEMRLSLERQRELASLKSRFVSMTSHEFRTPLAAILSSAELLKDYGDRLPAAERIELIDIVRSSVRRMTAMIENVLTIGRAEADRLEFAPRPVDLVALAQKFAVEATRAVDPAPTATIRTAVTDVGGCACLDEALLGHILGNLLSNALKYSPGGGTVTFEVDGRSDEIEFRVVDEGIGIPAEDLPALFQTFHRGRNVGGITGTGLGLAIVDRAVRAHGGRVSVDSAPGRGSRFTVVLPRG